jgi:magnesium transporter
VDGSDLRTGGSADLDAARKTGPVWVDVLEPDAETLAPLATTFGIHALAVEDCLHFPQRPKLDAYPGHVFLAWTLPHLVPGDGIDYAELDSVMGKGYLLTSHRQPLDVLGLVSESAGCILERGPEWTLHAILDRAVDEVFPAVDHIAERLDGIEDRLLQRARNEDLQELYAMKRLLVALYRTLGPERDALRAMARETDIVSEEAYRYFQDIGDHLARVSDAVDTYRDVASGAMDIYLSAVNNRMNEIMKQLTVVATIFMPLTLLTGIYGMNLTKGMWPSTEAGWAFGALMAFMAVIAVGMLWLFKRRNWW